jgi:hypothetical protein
MPPFPGAAGRARLVGLEGDGVGAVVADPPTAVFTSELCMPFVFIVLGMVAAVEFCAFGIMVLILGRECEGVGRGLFSGGEDVEGVIAPFGGNAFLPGTPILIAVPFTLPGAVGRAFFPVTMPDPGVIGGVTFEVGGKGGKSASFFGLPGPLNEEGPADCPIGLEGYGFHPGGKWTLAGLAPPPELLNPTLLTPLGMPIPWPWPIIIAL